MPNLGWENISKSVQFSYFKRFHDLQRYFTVPRSISKINHKTLKKKSCICHLLMQNFPCRFMNNFGYVIAVKCMGVLLIWISAITLCGKHLQLMYWIKVQRYKPGLHPNLLQQNTLLYTNCCFPSFSPSWFPLRMPNRKCLLSFKK